MSSTSDSSERDSAARVDIVLEARPERHLVRPTGSKRHVDFVVRVLAGPAATPVSRLPLTLGLVIDRSGSMHGDKLRTAKAAALAVLDQLDARDRVALVVFDDHIDVLRELTPVTLEVKAHARAELARIEARGSTALHEGWLTGCRAIAPTDTAMAPERQLARCYLLTDGLANVGETDHERIASEAAGIREHAGVGTSTFGIGEDYDEGLLGPMAVAGWGQFHSLRSVDEIARTFSGELGELLAVAAPQVRIEIQADRGVRAEVISAYQLTPGTQPVDGRYTWTVGLGDLLNGDEKHAVVRFAFPPRPEGSEDASVRARVVWGTGRDEHATAWHEVRFTYASQSACDDEPQDPAVMRWVGKHSADRAHREALLLSKNGDMEQARHVLRSASRHISQYAADDAELRTEVAGLDALDEQIAERPLSSRMSKEAYFQRQRSSRSQRDYRGGAEPPEQH